MYAAASVGFDIQRGSSGGKSGSGGNPRQPRSRSSAPPQQYSCEFAATRKLPVEDSVNLTLPALPLPHVSSPSTARPPARPNATANGACIFSSDPFILVADLGVRPGALHACTSSNALPCLLLS